MYRLQRRAELTSRSRRRSAAPRRWCPRWHRSRRGGRRRHGLQAVEGGLTRT